MARKTRRSSPNTKASISRPSKAAKKKPAAKKPSKAAAKRSTQAASSSSTPTLALRAFCRSLPGTTEDIKWEDHLTFCVGAKIFAGFDVNEASYPFGFKCDDDDFNRLTALGEQNSDSIIPAPYAARFGWVKVMREGALPDAEIQTLLRKSYDLVVATLPKRLKPNR